MHLLTSKKWTDCHFGPIMHLFRFLEILLELCRYVCIVHTDLLHSHFAVNLRDKVGWNQNQLSKRYGINYTYICPYVVLFRITSIITYFVNIYMLIRKCDRDHTTFSTLTEPVESYQMSRYHRKSSH